MCFFQEKKESTFISPLFFSNSGSSRKKSHNIQLDLQLFTLNGIRNHSLVIQQNKFAMNYKNKQKKNPMLFLNTIKTTIFT